MTTAMRTATIMRRITADHNMRAAYVHVLADAATSLLAIAALAAGLLWHIGFLDPLVGVIGAFVIASWAYGLIRDSALVLLDAEDSPHLAARIRGHLEQAEGTRVSDLHLWRLGPGHRGLIVSLVSPAHTDSEAIKTGLRRHFPDLSHVTVEVAVCADCWRAIALFQVPRERNWRICCSTSDWCSFHAPV